MIFAVAKNRLWNLRHDRAALVLSFVVPIVFFSVFATIFAGSSTRATTRRVPVAVVDEDRSETARRFVAVSRNARRGADARAGENEQAGMRAQEIEQLADHRLIVAHGDMRCA